MPPGASFGDLAFDVYRIVPPGDSIEFVATLDDATGKGIRPELDGTGSGQFTLSRQSPHATTDVLTPGNLVKARLPDVQTDPIFSFFLDAGDFGLVDRDEEGGEDLHFGGRGSLSYWGRAIWLSKMFEIPWWPACIDEPLPAGATGAVEVVAGRYRIYNVDEGETPPIIDGTNVEGHAFHTEDFADDWCSTFDSRRTYKWPAAGSKRFLVRLLEGPYNGEYFHPHQDGVTEWLPSGSQGYKSGIPLSTFGLTPGEVLYKMYLEGVHVDRPAHPIPLMTVDFDSSTDSDANPWVETDALAGLAASIGDYYIDTLGQLLGTGVLDTVMGPDLDMHVYNHYGRNLTGGTFGTGVVRFEKGSGPGAGNIADALVREVRDAPIATFAEVQGNDDTFAQVEIPSAASFVAREVSVSANTDTPESLEAVGLSDLQLRLARGEAVAFAIAVGDDEATGLYTPGPPGSTGHFWIGDDVTLWTGTEDSDYTDVSVRVTAITMAEDDAGSLVAIVEVRTGPLPAAGSLSSDTPVAAATNDCGCPCDLGIPYPLEEET